jgi:hypothetical protein
MVVLDPNFKIIPDLAVNSFRMRGATQAYIIRVGGQEFSSSGYVQ